VRESELELSNWLLDPRALPSIFVRDDVVRQDKILAILASLEDKPTSVARIRAIAVEHGMPEAAKWNVSNILARSQKRALRFGSEGWILSQKGREHLESLGLAGHAEHDVRDIVRDLRQLVQAITNQDTQAFAQETVRCLESRLFRAAVVFSWVGAVSCLHTHVVDQLLHQFNAEARRRDSRWRNATTADGLARMKEHDFLDALEAMGVIGKNVKQRLQQCLQLRNSCGHPNSLRVGQREATAHVEALIQNVFQRF
jgi:hypothetical protein